jgi:hypothetical protein
MSAERDREKKKREKEGENVIGIGRTREGESEKERGERESMKCCPNKKECVASASQHLSRRQRRSSVAEQRLCEQQTLCAGVGAALYVSLARGDGAMGSIFFCDPTR